MQWLRVRGRNTGFRTQADNTTKFPYEKFTKKAYTTPKFKNASIHNFHLLSFPCHCIFQALLDMKIIDDGGFGFRKYGILS